MDEPYPPAIGGILCVDYACAPRPDGSALITRYTWVIDRNGDKDVFTDEWVELGVADPVVFP